MIFLEEREISLKELFQVVWNGKFLIIIAAAIAFVIAFSGALIYNNQNSQVSTIITLQWSGITDGEYPDGIRFDYNTAIEPYVISLALEEQGITDISTNQIRQAVDFVPIIPSSALQVIQKALERGEQISYYPTDYKVVLNNGALGLSVEEGRDLLNSLIEQYRIDFEKKYISQSVILDFTDIDFKEYDYMDIYAILDTQIVLIENIMNNRVEVDSGFVSTSLGIGFSDILVRTRLVRQLELDQISSRVSTYLLTKDPEYLITNYTYQIDVKQLELDKAVINEADAQEMVDNYDGSVTTILIPGMDPTQALEVDSYYDVLLGNLVAFNKQISELTNDIAYYQLQIDRLEGNDPNFLISQAKHDEEIARVENTINNANSSLEDIMNDANILLVEYNAYTTSNVIKPLMTPTYEPNISKLLVSAVGLVIGAGIGGVIVLFRHDWE